MVAIPDYVRSSILKAMHDAKLNAIDELVNLFQAKVFTDKPEGIASQVRITLHEYKARIESSYSEDDTLKKRVKPERKRRAQTAYNQYIGQRMKELKPTMTGVSSKELMKVAMDSWKQLPNEEKSRIKSEFLSNANSA